jgi:GxxExxY protein
MDQTHYSPISEELNALARIVVDCAYVIHRELGPGLLESVYEHCMLYELHDRNIPVRTQVRLPVVYRNCKLDAGLRLDMLVDDQLLVELKTVEAVLPVHRAQLLSYLKLADLRLGLLINFNVAVIKDGIQRVVN